MRVSHPHQLPPAYQFTQLQQVPALRHVITTRSRSSAAHARGSLNLGFTPGARCAQVQQDHRLLARMLQCRLTDLVSCRQVHGTRIVAIDARGGPVFTGDADGLMTATAGIGLVVRVADCVPLLLCAPDQPALAVVHAGWRGTLAGIAPQAVAALQQRYGCRADRLWAGIGPAIGPCCFTVGAEVASAFGAAFDHDQTLLRQAADGWHIDLGGCLRPQLTTAGLDPHRIESAGLCTACNSDIFFSHRREQGKAGRFALAALLRC